MKALNYLIIIAASAFTFVSCTKQEAGPTGPTGATGAQGPSSSYYIVIDSAAGGVNPPGGWNNSGSTLYTFNIPVSYLTTPNNSIVEVYYSNSNNAFSQYFELPLQNFLAANDEFNYYYDLYNVTIQYNNPASAPPANPWTYFKVIIITKP